MSIVAACVLVALKLGTGLATGSLALVSAGVESSGDVIAARPHARRGALRRPARRPRASLRTPPRGEPRRARRVGHHRRRRGARHERGDPPARRATTRTSSRRSWWLFAVIGAAIAIDVGAHRVLAARGAPLQQPRVPLERRELRAATSPARSPCSSGLLPRARRLRPRGRARGARRRHPDLRRGRRAWCWRTRACSWTARPSRRAASARDAIEVARPGDRAAAAAPARVRRALLRRRRRRRDAGHRGRRRPRRWPTASRTRSTTCCPPATSSCTSSRASTAWTCATASWPRRWPSRRSREAHDIQIFASGDRATVSLHLKFSDELDAGGGARGVTSASRRRSSPTPEVEAVETHLEPLERPVPQRRASQAELVRAARRSCARS